MTRKTNAHLASLTHALKAFGSHTSEPHKTDIQNFRCSHIDSIFSSSGTTIVSFEKKRYYYCCSSITMLMIHNQRTARQNKIDIIFQLKSKCTTVFTDTDTWTQPYCIYQTHTTSTGYNKQLICTFETSAPCDCAVSKATTARASGTGLKTLTQLLNEQLAAYRKKLVISSGGLDNVQVVRVQNSVRVKWDIKCSGKCNCTVGGVFVPASKTFDSYFWAARPTRRRTYLNSSSSHFAERAPQRRKGWGFLTKQWVMDNRVVSAHRRRATEKARLAA